MGKNAETVGLAERRPYGTPSLYYATLRFEPIIQAICACSNIRFSVKNAETVGFEPTVRQNVQRLSKPPP